MKQLPPKRIVLIGSGNVATHLAKGLRAAGHSIVQVYSRTLPNAQKLAKSVDASALDDLSTIDRYADFYLVAVKDDAIPTVAGLLPKDLAGIVAHTAGSVAMNALEREEGRHCGVIYPVQTFSVEKNVHWLDVPIAIEGINDHVEHQLTELAETVTEKVFRCDSGQRLALHVAAVFSCNFTNHLYAIAADILSKNALNLDLIRPLIQETADKAQQLNPRDAQTGPAARNDQKTLRVHQQFLRSQPDIQALYIALSNQILQYRQATQG